MQIWQSIKVAYAVFQALNRFRKELDAQGVKRLSRERAKQLRRRTQIFAMDIIEGKNEGWRRWLQVDDAIGPFLAQYLDSELLESYISAPSALGRQQARQKILDEAGPAAMHGNHP